MKKLIFRRFQVNNIANIDPRFIDARWDKSDGAIMTSFIAKETGIKEGRGKDEVTYIDPPILWNFARPDQPSMDPYSPEFKRVTPNAAVINDEKEIDLFLSEGKILKETLIAKEQVSASDPKLHRALVSEIDKAKFTWLKGRPSGWQYNQAHSPSVNPDDYAIEVWKILDALWTRAAAYGSVKAAKFYPPIQGTNSGWPTFMKGVIAKLIPCLIRGGNFNASMRNGIEFSRMVGLPEEIAWCYGQASRLMVADKLLPINDNFVQIGESTSQCRVRGVDMASHGTSHDLDPYINELKQGQINLDEFSNLCGWHTKDKLEKTRRMMHKFKYWYKIDQKSYDSHWSEGNQMMISTHSAKKYPLAPTWYEYEQRPIVIKHEHRKAMVVWKRGKISSGLATTSSKGTKGAFWLILNCVGRCFDLKPTGILPFVNNNMWVAGQGDDGLLGSNRPIDTNRWTERASELGFEAEIIEGDNFLSQHCYDDGWHANAVRIVQNSFSPEYVEDSPEIAILGLAARWGDLGPIPELADYVRGFLQKFSFYASHGIYDGITARAWLDRNKGRLADVLKKRDDASYIARLRRDKEYDPTAATMYDWFVKNNIISSHDENASIAFDKLLYDKLHKVITWNRDKRLNLAASLYQSLIDRKIESDDMQLFQRLIK